MIYLFILLYSTALLEILLISFLLFFVFFYTYPLCISFSPFFLSLPVDSNINTCSLHDGDTGSFGLIN